MKKYYRIMTDGNKFRIQYKFGLVGTWKWYMKFDPRIGGRCKCVEFDEDWEAAAKIDKLKEREKNKKKPSKWRVWRGE